MWPKPATPEAAEHAHVLTVATVEMQLGELLCNGSAELLTPEAAARILTRLYAMGSTLRALEAVLRAARDPRPRPAARPTHGLVVFQGGKR